MNAHIVDICRICYCVDGKHELRTCFCSGQCIHLLPPYRQPTVSQRLNDLAQSISDLQAQVATLQESP